jgi:hypothetical protein
LGQATKSALVSGTRLTRTRLVQRERERERERERKREREIEREREREREREINICISIYVESRALRELMSRHLATAPQGDASKTYVHFSVPANSEEELAQVFAELEERRVELGIVDVQLAMSTLEDVFLKIAKDSEVEEATRENVRTEVTLSNNEKVQVLVGSEEPAVSPGGIGFKVMWNTDEDGKLVVDETIEDEPRQVTALVLCVLHVVCKVW